MDREQTAVYALTPRGAELGERLARALGGRLFVTEVLARPGAEVFGVLAGHLAGVFHAYRAHVFVAACGAVVRLIAPLLKGKDADPAVVVLDQDGRFAVSLLSGHLGGANALAREIAAITGGQAVITTATDSLGLPAFDLIAKDLGLAIENVSGIKPVNAALAAGESVAVFDPLGCLSRAEGVLGGRVFFVASPGDLPTNGPGLLIDYRLHPRPAGTLALRPKVLAVGVGCRRGVPAGAIIAAIEAALSSHRLSPLSIKVLASIEAKRDEAGLIQAAREYGAGLVFFSAGELAGVSAPSPSAVVAKHMGVSSVCEAAAMLAAGTTRLLAAKHKTREATAAVALAG